jgi:arginase
MPLACLLGRGDKRLLNIGLAGMQLSAAHTVVLGARSCEPEEIDFLQARGVRMINSEEIIQRGFAACLSEAIAIVASAPAGFGVTLDLDAIDPLLAPGVGSPEPEGLWDGDVVLALRRLAMQPGLRAMKSSNTTDRDRQE